MCAGGGWGSIMYHVREALAGTCRHLQYCTEHTVRRRRGGEGGEGEREA